MSLPKNFKENYLTQKMAMSIGRKLNRNDFYGDVEKTIRGLLIEPIEKESGRGFKQTLDYVKTLDLSEFTLKCKPFAK